MTHTTKRTLAVALALIALLIGSIWYAMRMTREEPPAGDVFSHVGNLVKDNPGMKPGIWHLSYEEPGAPGLLVELHFDEESRCGHNASPIPCANLVHGARVEVEGLQTDSIVRVQRLDIQETSPEQGVTVKLYYYNPAFDQGPGGVQCTEKGLVAVERVIPQTITPLQDAIRLLLRGEISEAERASGITSEFPLAHVELANASIDSTGLATLTFNDPENKTGGGSCRVSILWHQIAATAKQFPAVTSVRFMPEELFQP